MRLSALLVLASVVACKSPGSSSALEVPQTAAADLDEGPAAPIGASFIEKLNASGQELSKLPVLLPSELWSKVAETGGDAEAAKLLAKLLVKMLAGQDRELINSVVTAGLGPALGSVVLLGVGTGVASADEITAMAGRLAPIVMVNPKLLDTIATVDLAFTGPIQARLFARGQGTGATNGVKPFMVPTPSIPTVDLTADDCEQGPDTYAPLVALQGGSLVVGRPDIREGVDPCFHQTSGRLATALNLLANNLVAGDTAIVKVQVREDAPAVSVKTYGELLEAFRSGGYTMDLFTTRVFVEFEPFVWKSGGELYTVQLNTWIAGSAGGSFVRAPAEHGELGFLLHRDGKRTAQVRWYAGLPDDKFPNQSAYWRPHPELSAPWSGSTHEAVETYGGDAQLAGALDWFNAAAHLMNGYQAINVAFDPPYETYGLLVCTDSMAAALAKIAELRETDARMTHAFPIVRAQLDVGHGLNMSLDAFLEKHGALAGGALSTRYPSDQTVVRDAAAWKRRLASAFPKNARRYQHFPAFKQALANAIHN